MLTTLLCSVPVLFTPVAAQTRAADLVLTEAAIWTADPERPEADWIALLDGRVAALGSGSPDAELIGDGTRVTSLEGRRVIPGLIDAHVHLAQAAQSLARLDVRGAASRDELLASVAAWADELGPEEWVLGRGWSAESWPDPTAPGPEELQRAAGGRPVVLVRMDGHSLVASAVALERAGIDAAGPADPAGGKIGRRADGSPDGALYESAMGLVTALVPEEDVARERVWMGRALERANGWGLTQVGAIEPRAALERILVPLDEEGGLSLRVRATLRDAGPSLSAWMRALAWLDAPRELSPRAQASMISSGVDSSGMLMVLLIAPDTKGCTAPSIFRCPM